MKSYKVIELDSVLEKTLKAEFIEKNNLLMGVKYMYDGPVEYYLKLLAKKNRNKNSGEDPYTMKVSFKHKTLEDIKESLAKYFDISKVGQRSRVDPCMLGYAFRFCDSKESHAVKNIVLEVIDRFINDAIKKIFKMFDESKRPVDVVTACGYGIIIRVTKCTEDVEVGEKKVSREEYKEYHHPGLNDEDAFFYGIDEEIDEAEGPDHKWTIPVYEEKDFYSFNLFCSNQML